MPKWHSHVVCYSDQSIIIVMIMRYHSTGIAVDGYLKLKVQPAKDGSL
jgi:hypothetical protein